MSHIPSKEELRKDIQLYFICGIIFLVATIILTCCYMVEANTNYYKAEATVTGFRYCDYHISSKGGISYTHYYNCSFLDRNGEKCTAYFGTESSSKEDREYSEGDKVTVQYTMPFGWDERVYIYDYEKIGLFLMLFFLVLLIGSLVGYWRAKMQYKKDCK